MEQEIREALDKATKGPWVMVDDSLIGSDRTTIGTLYDEENQDLIVKMPEYLEWCLSQIAELRKENERLKKYVMWSEMRYRHYKGGIYTVIAEEAKHSETGEMDVVYANEIGDVWIRPYQMFHGFTEDGRKRFELINCPEGTEATE